jgi:hypothetical protein
VWITSRRFVQDVHSSAIIRDTKFKPYRRL